MRLLIVNFALFLTVSVFAQEFEFKAEDIDIPHTMYTLPNGLKLIVHEDHKAPIVAVNLWYHVGSKDEKPGKSGFAHLFEHLMFNGSENFNDDYFQALERIGGTDLNGTTNNDRTNYFQNVPVSSLDQVLFLESDRMGHLLGVIDQERLDEQRGVVQNEKRQGENQPYGRQYDLITKAMFPKGHPYSWTVIGEMEDLNAASLEDVQEWFKTYYGPNNAVIAIAGDVEAEDMYQRVLKYFGHIPAGPTLAKFQQSIPARTIETRQVYQDRVPEIRLVQVWNTPKFGDREDAHFDLISSILTTGKNSRMFKKLVYEDQTASSVNSFQWSKEISSNFVIQANVKPGQSAEEVEATLDQVLAEFLETGPTETELNRAKASYFSGFIKGMERIGGFGGKTDILARSATYFDDPEYYKIQLRHVSEATIADLKNTAKKWLSQGKHTLVCEPFPEYSVTTSEVDRSALPELGSPVSATFPELQKTTLDNGMKVVLAQRSDVPTVVMNLLVDAGYASDQFAAPGTAALAMNMMDEGTEKLSTLEINEKLQLLGASLYSGSDLDHSFVSMNTLKPSLDQSLDLFAEVVLNPAFPQSELDRLKKEQIVRIQREKSQPIQMALRVIPQYLYGTGHAYSLPLTGSGYENTVGELKREDIVSFYQSWMKPNNATLVVVGDIELDYLTGKLEDLFGSWKPGDVPEKNIAQVKTAQKNTLYLMDRPESEQSVILAGHLTNPYGEVSEIARETMINVLGGEFTSRINMNLREDKHWAYGAGGFVWNAKGQRPLMVYAPVQTDKTSESVAELIKEVNAFVGDQPITAEELEKVNTNNILALPGSWETNGAVANSINSIVKYELADDYYQTYDQEVRNLTLDQVRETSNTMIQPSELNWFIVGDKAKIMEGLEQIGFSEIVEIDADGKPLGLGGKIELE
jgi:predicted Zn-dependent peptidase